MGFFEKWWIYSIGERTADEAQRTADAAERRADAAK